jgi:hypothetical protein
MLREHAGDLTEEQRRAILSGNVTELYELDVAPLA